VAYGAVKQAAAMYSGKGFDPHQAYDIDIASALLREQRTRTE
jgi:hypothetical protein